nr:glucosamine-6-phosphate deaminase [uncultured Devosia sp.]
MKTLIHDNPNTLGQQAAIEGAQAIHVAVEQFGGANIIVATGASQFATLDHLVGQDLDWGRLTIFHLDEYVGLGANHPASFRRYLRERLLDRLPGPVAEFVAVDGDATDLDAELARLNQRIGSEAIHVCFAGIGENCHLAFNDPPADFQSGTPYIVVELDEACRRQQMGEGWFENFDAVPRRAISMSIRQIMKADRIVLSVPDERKAVAVRKAVEEPVSPMHPASILQQHGAASLHLDRASASLLV